MHCGTPLGVCRRQSSPPHGHRFAPPLALPRPLRGKPCRVTTSQMKDGDKTLQRLDEEEVKPSDTVHIERELEGEAIYVFDVGGDR